MLSFRRITTLVFNQPTHRIVMNFSGNNWKDRDEAAEKVYISQAEKQTIKKLLKKVEAEQDDHEPHLEQFQRRLGQIMNRYKINNEALTSDIIELHRDVSK